MFITTDPYPEPDNPSRHPPTHLHVSAFYRCC